MARFLSTLISILILIAVLIPGSNIPDVKMVGIDKLVHIVMFASWAVSVKFDYPRLKPVSIFLLGMVFSLLTEVLQLFAEDRTFDLTDMVADGVGLLAGMLVSNPLVRILRQILKR